ncbi:facilitated trehalose transporter Tret1-like [Macrobrachium rosenbergii]|uniref:facilitated trehalose transporter Tret1-like n=1 Tax=Macrobrachium rosenbergii TaxID=79674 RepID=UPI0034D448BB
MECKKPVGIINEGYTKNPEEEIPKCKQKYPEDRPKEDPQEKRSRLMKQGMKMFLVSLGKWSIGSMLTFPSVVANDLRQNNTTMFGTPISLTDSQMDMLSSFLSIFTIVGALMAAPIINVIGRRLCMVISGVIVTLGWLGVVILPGAAGLLVARSICGVGLGSISVAINIYIVEIPDPEVRGIVFIVVNNGILAGQLLTMAVGYGARYFVVAIVNAVLPFVFVISQLWLPESPSFLVVKGREEAARKVLLELKGPSADIESEIMSYKTLNQISKSKEKGSWRELLKPDVLKDIIVVCNLFTILYFAGYYVISANTSRIFVATGSTVDGSLAALIITAVQLIPGIASSFLIDRLGRVKSLIISYSCICVPLTVMAVYSAFADAWSQEYRWIPLVCLVISQAAGVLGANPIPFILSNEYFPTSIRSQASSICYTIGTVAGFLTLQLYTPMAQEMTQAGLYAFYASVSAAGVAFSYFFVTETRGKKVG